MPLYEYECLSCGERFERLCPILDADKAKTFHRSVCTAAGGVQKIECYTNERRM